jgi:hypothetical protein
LTVVVHAERNSRHPAQKISAQSNTAADFVACTKVIKYFLNKIRSKMEIKVNPIKNGNQGKKNAMRSRVTLGI